MVHAAYCSAQTAHKPVRISSAKQTTGFKSLLSIYIYCDHRKKEVSNYLCQFCNKSFTTETSLKRHILIHENRKPFSCKVCEKGFRQKSALMAHERVHTGMRFECLQCNKKFITKSLMKKHLNLSHKQL